MTGRDVHRTCAAVHRDKIGGENDGLPIQKWVLSFDPVDLAPLKRFDRFANGFEFRVRGKLRNELFGQQ